MVTTSSRHWLTVIAVGVVVGVVVGVLVGALVGDKGAS